MRFVISTLVLLIGTSASATEDRLARLQDALAADMYEKNPGAMLDELVESGLDPSDSEKIVSKFNHAIAGCLIDAIREYSTEMSLDFDEQIDTLEKDLADGVAGKYMSSLDQAKLERIIIPCVLVARQATGLSVPEAGP